MPGVNTRPAKQMAPQAPDSPPSHYFVLPCHLHLERWNRNQGKRAINVFQKINIPHDLFLQIKRSLCTLWWCARPAGLRNPRTAHVKAQVIPWSSSDQGAHQQSRMQHHCWGGHSLGPGAGSKAKLLRKTFPLLAVRVTIKLKFTYKCPMFARDTVHTKILSPFQHSLQGENNCDLKQREDRLYQK